MANGENSFFMEFFPLPTNPLVPPLTGLGPVHMIYRLRIYAGIRYSHQKV